MIDTIAYGKNDHSRSIPHLSPTKGLIQKATYAFIGSALLMAVPLSANADAPLSKIAQNYEDSCAVCHASGALNAPKTGDSATWSRLKTEKGLDTLIKSVKNGITQMPAGGLCQTCSDEDYRTLIEYMAK